MCHNVLSLGSLNIKNRYNFSVDDIFIKQHIQYHKYADDTQLYVAFDLSSENSLTFVIEKLKDCICDISQWISTNRLKHNEEKPEVVVFKMPHFKRKPSTDSIS